VQANANENYLNLSPNPPTSRTNGRVDPLDQPMLCNSEY
jgi:hypothetical protein